MNRGHLRHSLLVELAVVAVWLAYLLWEQGVGGSNPLAPTSKIKDIYLLVSGPFWPTKLPSYWVGSIL